MANPKKPKYNSPYGNMLLYEKDGMGEVMFFAHDHGTTLINRSGLVLTKSYVPHPPSKYSVRRDVIKARKKKRSKAHNTMPARFRYKQKVNA